MLAGRPRKPAKERRSGTVRFRATADELRAYAQVAKDEGKTVSDLARAAVNRYVVRRLRAEAKRLRGLAGADLTWDKVLTQVAQDLSADED